MTLTLRNPHSVLAAISSRPHDVHEIRLPRGGGADAWADVAAAAKAAEIRAVQLVERDQRQDREGRTSGACAIVSERAPQTLDEVFSDIASHPTGLWLALDCLQDPQNVGAIFRTAAFLGVRGIVTTKDRSAPLSATVYDVASGGLEVISFAQPTNLQQAFELAKEAGLWIVGTSEHAEKLVSQVPRDRPWLVVVGNEERGLRRLTQDRCDEVCRIPCRGGVTSLNVSVATGIVLATLAGT